MVEYLYHENQKHCFREIFFFLLRELHVKKPGPFLAKPGILKHGMEHLVANSRSYWLCGLLEPSEPSQEAHPTLESTNTAPCLKMLQRPLLSKVIGVAFTSCPIFQADI